MRRGFLNKPKTSRSDSAPQAEPNQPPAPNIDQTQAFEPVKRVDLFSDGTTHKNESDKNRLGKRLQTFPEASRYPIRHFYSFEDIRLENQTCDLQL